MGVGINTAAALVGTLGVSANKVSTSIGSKIGSAISESNDGEKNELMSQKAQMNMEKLKEQKLKNKKLRLQNRQLKQKIDKNTLKKEGDK